MDCEELSGVESGRRGTGRRQSVPGKMLGLRTSLWRRQTKPISPDSRRAGKVGDCESAVEVGKEVKTVILVPPVEGAWT